MTDRPRKTFVLDANVLLHDPNALFAFEGNIVVIPITALEEIDNFKRREDEVGRASRAVARVLDGIRMRGDVAAGVPLDHNGELRIEIRHQDGAGLPPALAPDLPDHRILSLALALQKSGDGPVCLVTKDINLRVKADAIGLVAEDYETNQVNIDELYAGTVEIPVAPEAVNAFYREKRWTPADRPLLFPNQFVTLRNESNPDQAGIGRYDAAAHAVVPLRHGSEAVAGIKALNREQRFALELLLDDSILLVTLVGIAGTGKTLLALAAGLRKVVDDDKYRRLLVSRPVVPMGRDIGYLPGTVEEKLVPRMAPIEDNLEYIFAQRGDAEDGTLERLREDGIVELEPLTYIRGRSIPNQFMIVDEAQNLTPLELKTIVTRAGKGTKVVLTGDPYQIDHPYLDSQSNGLVYVVERFKGEPIFGHVTLVKGERSDLAEAAARRM
jgi:PhoH-like ATPase